MNLSNRIKNEEQLGAIKYTTGHSATICVDIFSLEGKGTYVFPTGTRYEGEFWDGMFHGKGTLFFANGSMYKGEWVEGTAVKVRLNVEIKKFQIKLIT